MPSLYTRFKAALSRMTFGRSGGSGGSGGVVTFGDSWDYRFAHPDQYDYQEAVGPLDGNAVVSICLGWITDNITEPDFEVAEKDPQGLYERVDDHPLPLLLSDPNPDYGGDVLWAWTAADYCLDGNAYWLKARGRESGRVMELWHVPAWRMRPCWPADGSEFISHYEYHVNGRWERREKDDVVHFADRLNFETRRGTSRLAGVLREVLSDNEAAAYTAHILKNMGVPGVIIGPKDGQFPIPDPARDRIEAMYTSKFTGTNRGRPLVSSDALDIHQVSFSPEQLALDKMRAVPACRICAALHLHPAVVHLGMDTTSGSLDNGGQHESARKAAYEDCLLPLGKRFARTIQRRLLPDFQAVTRNSLCRWNTENVEALSENADDVSKRKVTEFLGGVSKLNEAREAVGLPQLDDSDARGELFYFQLKPAPGAPEFEPDGKLKEPEPVPAGLAGAAPLGLDGQPPPGGPPPARPPALNGAAKALAGTRNGYRVPDVDPREIAAAEFSGIEAFWEQRRQRWAAETEGPDDEYEPDGPE